jgi:sugar phosphate isomerase/epimerase
MRTTLAGTAAAFAAQVARPAARASEPIKREGSHLKLSLAAYSFQRYLPRNQPLSKFHEARMTLDDVIRLAARENLDGVELTGYYFPKDVTSDYLVHLKELTFRLGLDISGTAIGNDFCVAPGPSRAAQLAHARQWIDFAATMGAPVIRIFAGHTPQGDSDDVAIGRCVEGIEQSLEYAGSKGVFLALENHGGITATAEGLLSIVRRVSPSPWFGVNFDSGNFASQDPYAELEKIAPYAINAQIKTEVSPGGRKQPADLARVVGILRKANYRGYLVLEYEARQDPLEAVPVHLKRLRELISQGA